MNETKRAAAKHSIEAFSLYSAVRKIRDTAQTTKLLGDKKTTDLLLMIAQRLDGRRRKMMGRPKLSDGKKD